MYFIFIRKKIKLGNINTWITNVIYHYYFV